MDDDHIDRLAKLYAAVGEPTRLRILGLLAEREATGIELSERLGLTPPTISHHMAKLVEAGLVRVTPDAQRRRFRLDLDALRSPVVSGGAGSPPPLDERAKIIRDFFDGDRLRQIPASRKKRVVVLRHLLERFVPDQEYPEREVNDLLRPAHDDVATLRRELVDYGFLVRDRGSTGSPRECRSAAPPSARRSAQTNLAGSPNSWRGRPSGSSPRIYRQTRKANSVRSISTRGQGSAALMLRPAPQAHRMRVSPLPRMPR
jgi:hypothetical protein